MRSMFSPPRTTILLSVLALSLEPELVDTFGQSPGNQLVVQVGSVLPDLAAKLTLTEQRLYEFAHPVFFRSGDHRLR